MSEQPNGSADAPQGPPQEHTHEYTQPYPQQAPPPYPGQPPYAGQPYTSSPYPPQPYGYPAAPEDPNARTAMITGIVTLVTGFALCGLGFLGSPVALVMGWRSMRRIDLSNGALRGRGDAQAGFILGIIGTAMLALAVMAVLAMIAFFVFASFTFDDFSDNDLPESYRDISVILAS